MGEVREGEPLPYGQSEATKSHPGTSAAWVPRAVTSVDVGGRQA